MLAVTQLLEEQSWESFAALGNVWPRRWRQASDEPKLNQKSFPQFYVREAHVDDEWEGKSEWQQLGV